MFYESAFIVLAVVLAYLFGCKRTQNKFELLSLMTPEKYRCFVEIKLYAAKAIIVLLLLMVMWLQQNA